MLNLAIDTAESIIGAAVLNPYSGHTGYIIAANPVDGGRFVIGGAGLKAVSLEYEIAYPTGVSTTPDGIAAPWIAEARRCGIAPAADIESVRANAKAAEMERRQRAANDSAEADKRRADFAAVAAGRVPAWAQAVIYADLEKDDCDSMTDYFNAKRVRRVILGFSSHKRDLFPELRKFAALFSGTAELAGADERAEHREKYSMGGGYYLKAGNRYSSGWRVYKSTFYGNRIPDVADWLQDLEPAAAPVETAPRAPGIGHNSGAAGFAIEKHFHTKGGFDFWLAVSAERVEREQFERQRDAAKAGGGWYSRAWGKTPGGFAFKSESAALAFVEAEGGAPMIADNVEAPAMTRSPAAPAPAIGDKLRGFADSLAPAIADKFRDRLANTPKRQREAGNARNDGRHLERAQKGLIALAAAHDAGTVPAVLASVKTKAAAVELAREAFDYGGGYYDAPRGLGKPANDTPAAVAFWALAQGGGVDPAAAKAEELRRKIEALQFARIPGYFPTPAAIVARMISESGIGDGARVLEPSAGSGNIADAVRAEYPGAALVCFERHNSLAEILAAKGHDVAGRDFTEAEGAGDFDAVVMNPPFESGQDMAHVQHAYTFLKPGGTLVAIMSPGPFFRSDRAAVDFRAWFEAVGGGRDDLPPGSFKESGTGVGAVLCVITRESI